MIFSVVKSLSPLGRTHTDLHVMLDMLDDDRKSLDSNCTSQNNSSSLVKVIGLFDQIFAKIRFMRPINETSTKKGLSIKEQQRFIWEL